MIGGPIMGGAKAVNRRIALEGQSNAMGVGDSAELSQPPLVSSDPGLAALYAATFQRVYIFNPSSGAYEKLKMGTNSQQAAPWFAAEFGLAVRWTRETTRGLLFIDKAHGNGQPISYFQQGSASGFYNTTISNRANGNAWLSANGIKVADMGLLWVQGEQGEYTGYDVALTTMINNKISAGLLPANAKIVIAKQYPASGGYNAGVRAGQDAYIAANPTTATGIVYPNYFNADNVHLNARGQLQLAYDAYSVLFSRTGISA